MNERFKELVKILISERVIRNQQDFCEIMGLTSSYVARLKSGDRAVSESIISRLVKNFPQINSDWLLTGEGEMLKSGVKQEGHKNNLQVGNNISYNADDRIKELLEANKKKDEQIDRLLTLLEKHLENK